MVPDTKTGRKNQKNPRKTLAPISLGWVTGRSEGFPLAAYLVPGRDGMGAWPNSEIVRAAGAASSMTNTSDFDNFGVWKCCSWISRLCGIGRRLRRLQRPGVVSFKAFTRNSKSQHWPKIGKFDCRKITKFRIFER